MNSALQATVEAAGGDILENEGYEIVRSIGITVPRAVMVKHAGEVDDMNLSGFPGSQVVVKVVSSRILHKTDVGGVRIVPREHECIKAAIQDMEARLAHPELAGFLICEFVHYDPVPGCELLLSARWTPDFGPLVFLGMGGTSAEYFSVNLRPGNEIVVLSPEFATGDDIRRSTEGKTVTPLITGDVRGLPVRLSGNDLVSLLQRFLQFARMEMPRTVTEIEMNPLVLTERGPVALDVLCHKGECVQPESPYPERPLWKMKNLLQPRSIAILGVSEKMNAGHIILNNILASGFPPADVRVVKQGMEEMDGCRCYPDIASLPDSTDLMILGIEASAVPQAVQQIVDLRKAESIILISGGLGEREGSQSLEVGVRASVALSRTGEWQGPLLNGGNCLGIRSLPGNYDTLFIPGHKLCFPDKGQDPIAVISQSGAFLVAVSGKLLSLNPCYLISAGNQTDLTMADYLTCLKDDPAIEVFACYLEGFRELDGIRWMRAAREITESGRTVILYRAGRTAAGATASASHTAAIAGDYAVVRELARQAGVLVVDSLADFTDLLRLFGLLRKKQVRGNHLAAMSNAGFECVAIADNLQSFELAAFREDTRNSLRALLEKARLLHVVSVRNPLDVTPLLDDAGYESAFRMILQDTGVDVGVLGCVPLTGSLNTLPRGPAHSEDLLREDSVVMRMIRLFHESSKAWVAVVDGGLLFDPMAALLERNGVPVFRSADSALRLFSLYCNVRLQRV